MYTMTPGPCLSCILHVREALRLGMNRGKHKLQMRKTREENV